ncbi:hypothetical protein CROQUDRAFT_708525 [Cronartium quercuum f. sp. fusiforme G11]|uniref:Uncharacterized protein n=1 Tax=Cronartium quercuum f. sp. fusiforme G11 TaxID=708437 RepID=A0A9P6NDH5_9BASI|nr:hypothetical protein CROQUDRAFT_708525 [Cronartium quercuum f. sp. fusiforme G11]
MSNRSRNTTSDARRASRQRGTETRGASSSSGQPTYLVPEIPAGWSAEVQTHLPTGTRQRPTTRATAASTAVAYSTPATSHRPIPSIPGYASPAPIPGAWVPTPGMHWSQIRHPTGMYFATPEAAAEYVESLSAAHIRRNPTTELPGPTKGATGSGQYINPEKRKAKDLTPVLTPLPPSKLGSSESPTSNSPMSSTRSPSRRMGAKQDDTPIVEPSLVEGVPSREHRHGSYEGLQSLRKRSEESRTNDPTKLRSISRSPRPRDADMDTTRIRNLATERVECLRFLPSGRRASSERRTSPMASGNEPVTSPHPRPSTERSPPFIDEPRINIEQHQTQPYLLRIRRRSESRNVQRPRQGQITANDDSTNTSLMQKNDLICM